MWVTHTGSGGHGVTDEVCKKKTLCVTNRVFNFIVQRICTLCVQKRLCYVHIR